MAAATTAADPSCSSAHRPPSVLCRRWSFSGPCLSPYPGCSPSVQGEYQIPPPPDALKTPQADQRYQWKRLPWRERHRQLHPVPAPAQQRPLYLLCRPAEHRVGQKRRKRSGLLPLPVSLEGKGAHSPYLHRRPAAGRLQRPAGQAAAQSESPAFRHQGPQGHLPPPPPPEEHLLPSPLPPPSRCLPPAVHPLPFPVQGPPQPGQLQLPLQTASPLSSILCGKP